MRPIHPRSWIGNNNISILSFDIKWPMRPRFRIVGECHIITKSSEKHKLYINKKSGQIMTTRLPLPLLDVLLDHVIHEFLNDAVHIVPRALPASACRPVSGELITQSRRHCKRLPGNELQPSRPGTAHGMCNANDIIQVLHTRAQTHNTCFLTGRKCGNQMVPLQSSIMIIAACLSLPKDSELTKAQPLQSASILHL